MYTCLDLFAFSGFEMKNQRKKRDAYLQQGLKLTLSNSGTKTRGKLYSSSAIQLQYFPQHVGESQLITLHKALPMSLHFTELNVPPALTALQSPADIYRVVFSSHSLEPTLQRFSVSMSNSHKTKTRFGQSLLPTN